MKDSEFFDELGTIESHPWVEEVTLVPLGDAGTCCVLVVPDRNHMPVLRSAIDREGAAKAAGAQLYEPAEDLVVFTRNTRECDFLYKEIFTDDAYGLQDIELPAEAQIVDIGANTGMFALHCARRYPRSRILAVEPIAESCQVFELNALTHGLRFQMVQAAVGASEGDVQFSYFPKNSVMSTGMSDNLHDQSVVRRYLTGSATEAAGDDDRLDEFIRERMTAERRTVRKRTLPDILREGDMGRVDLLKIDVERAELDVLVGMDDTCWEKVSQVVIETEQHRGNLGAVTEVLSARGFATVARQPESLKGTEFFTVHGIRRGLGTPARGPAGGYTPQTRRALAEALVTHMKSKGWTRQVIVEVVPHIVRGSHDSVEERWLANYLPQLKERAQEELGSQTEAELASIWKRVLNLGELGPHADFFAIGGSSLSAVRLIMEVERHFGDDVLSPDALFECRTLRRMAGVIHAAGTRR